MRDTARAALAHGVALGRIRVFLTARILAAVPCSARQRRSTRTCSTRLARWMKSSAKKAASCSTSNRMARCITRPRAMRPWPRRLPAPCMITTPGLKLVGLAGGALVRQARLQGLNAVEEVFADRAYLADGNLAPRELPGAVIVNPVRRWRRPCGWSSKARSPARMVAPCSCAPTQRLLHGDSAHALDVAGRLRARLEAPDSGVSRSEPA